MAAAQRVLYSTTEATQFSAGEFLEAVCSTTRQTFLANIKVIWQSDPAELSNDVAMPLALTLNELLTNAVKHGCDASGQGAISVALRTGGEPS